MIVIINAMGSTLKAYDKLIAIGMKIITVALFVKKFVNKVTIINMLHNTKILAYHLKKT